MAPREDGHGRPDHPSKLGDLAAEAGLERVHVLAWRDLADVEAGGSELHAAEIMRRWVAAGIEVTIRTSYAQGSPPESVRDGYRVIRKAGRYMVFPRAAISEMVGRHGPRDGIVEIWNGMPFLTPLWTRKPRMIFLHHLHEDMWPLVLSPNLAKAGQTFERSVAPWAYRNSPVVTLSTSSKQHLVDRTPLRAEQISVVTPGIDDRFTPAEGAESKAPLIVAVGRLMPSKHFDQLIEIVVELRRSVPDLRLTIVGEGYEQDALARQIADNDAEGYVELAGRLSDAELVELYQRAWVATSVSSSEGWGMTLTEAAACATPAVATDIPGHADAVDAGNSGLLTSREGVADALRRVLTDDSLRGRLGAGALAHAERFRWDRTAYETLAVLAEDAHRRRR